MLQPITPPPTITTCARLGAVPLVVSGSIVTMYLPGRPTRTSEHGAAPAVQARRPGAGRDQGAGAVPD